MNFFRFLWEKPIYILWIYLAIINIISFVTMGMDKQKAIKGKMRISESSLFLLVVLGGSLGGIGGMYAFRHKTLKKKFVIGFPAIFILQLAFGIFLCVNLK